MTTTATTMKVYAIKSTEYEANVPDTFLMDTDGNYYGVDEHSYAHFYNYPKDIDHWRRSTCSDADRYFCIYEVELDAAQVEHFDAITREYIQMEAEQPTFGEQYPASSDFSTKKAYNKAVDEYLERYNEWSKTSGIAQYITRWNELTRERARLFNSFISKAKDND